MRLGDGRLHALSERVFQHARRREVDIVRVELLIASQVNYLNAARGRHRWSERDMSLAWGLFRRSLENVGMPVPGEGVVRMQMPTHSGPVNETMIERNGIESGKAWPGGGSVGFPHCGILLVVQVAT